MKETKPYTPKDRAIVSKTMSRIRGKDTKIEVKLRKALYEKGFRYRCNSSKAFGHPDLVNKRLMIAIFVDGEFWHGYNFDEAKKSIKIHESYWIPKIERNIQRDKEVTAKLERQGYIVLRYWGFEVNKELDRVLEDIDKHIAERERVLSIKAQGLVKTTLCYLEKDGRYLMMHRTKKKNDLNSGKWVGVGGHLEAGESIAACAKREILEETGLKATKLKYLGYIDFLNSSYPPERMYLYKGIEFEGELIECDEGDLHWIDKDKVLELPLWEGDNAFLPLLDSKEKHPFQMTLLYEDDKLVSIQGPYYKE